MAFMKTTGTHNVVSVLRRIRVATNTECGQIYGAANIFTTNVGQMSTQSSSTPPSAGSRKGTSQSGKTTIIAALGGILTFGGGVYLYKTYTDDKFGFENLNKWISRQFGWERPTVAEKMLGIPTSRPKPETIKAAASETQPNCAQKNDHATREESDRFTKIDKEEVVIAKTNQELELALKDVKPKAMAATEVTEKATTFSDDIAPPDTPAGLAISGRLDELKEYYEGELLSTLARQAQIYQENLQEIKSTMQAEYDRKLKQKSDIAESESLVELRKKNQLVAIALDAMELALSERKSQDDRSQNLKKLWTYCNSLYSQINYACEGAPGYNTSIKINKEYLLNEFSGDEFAVLLLKTIPDSIGSSEGLKERFFNKIDKTCRKVAVFKEEERITIWKYIVGCIQGSLVSRCDGEKATSEDIFELLDRTGFHLRRGEFLEAIATLSRLEGVPRQVCMDWLRDAIAVLEANQTLFALMTHAYSKNVC
jgi:hypothetical protein